MKRPKPKRPKPLSEGQLKAYAHRKPLAGDERWAWRVAYHEGPTQHNVKGAGGRYTRREMADRLRDLAERGGWKQQPQQQQPKGKQNMRTLLALWLTHQRKRAKLGRITDSTVTLYTQIRAHLRPLDDHPLTGFRLATLQDWIDEMDAAGGAPRSIQDRYAVLRAAWRWGRARGYCAAVDLPPVEMPRIKGYVYNHRTPSAAEVEQVRAQLGDWAGVYLDVLRYTGARTGEVASLTWDHLQMKASNVIRLHKGLTAEQARIMPLLQHGDPEVRAQGEELAQMMGWTRDRICQIKNARFDHARLRLDGKTGARIVPISGPLGEVMEVWRAERIGTAFWPVSCPEKSFELRLKVACRRAGVERFTPHGLRRLASTHLIAAGTDPKAYEGQMGHKYAEGLSTYAGVVGENLQAAAEVLGRVHTSIEQPTPKEKEA